MIDHLGKGPLRFMCEEKQSNAWVNAEMLWAIFGIACLAVVFITIMYSIWAQKPIRGYYLTGGEGGSKTCVWVDTEWAVDSRAFCTDDISFAIQSVRELNASLR